MAKILDSQWNLFSDGQVSDADKVSDNIYKPGISTSSLEHINGHLDRLNVPVSTSSEYWKIDGSLVQKGTFTGGSMVGATGNLDFFRNPHFADTHRENVYGPDEQLDSDGKSSSISYFDPATEQVFSSGVVFPTDEDFVPVPGASIEFYLPYDCTMVLFTWNVQFEDDGDSGYSQASTFLPPFLASLVGPDRNAYYVYGLTGSQAVLTRTWLRFYIDDAWVPGQERISYPDKRRPYKDVSNRRLPSSGSITKAPRYWNGHHAASTSDNTQLTKGWHSASIRIYSNSNQSRVRVRGIRHVYFR